MKANLFKSVKNTTPNLTREVPYFLDRIRNGKSKRLIERIRSAENEDARKAIKLSLPAVCFNGTFSQRAKDKVNDERPILGNFRDYSNKSNSGYQVTEVMDEGDEEEDLPF